jgi:hypothetical protein
LLAVGLASHQASAAPANSISVLGFMFKGIAGSPDSGWQGENVNDGVNISGASMFVGGQLFSPASGFPLKITATISSASWCEFQVIDPNDRILQIGPMKFGTSSMQFQQLNLGTPLVAQSSSLMVVCKIEANGGITKAWQ